MSLTAGQVTYDYNGNSFAKKRGGQGQVKIRFVSNHPLTNEALRVCPLGTLICNGFPSTPSWLLSWSISDGETTFSSDAGDVLVSPSGDAGFMVGAGQYGGSVSQSAPTEIGTWYIGAMSPADLPAFMAGAPIQGKYLYSRCCADSSLSPMDGSATGMFGPQETDGTVASRDGWTISEDAAATPEPGTLGFAGIGVLALLAARARLR